MKSTFLNWFSPDARRALWTFVYCNQNSPTDDRNDRFLPGTWVDCCIILEMHYFCLIKNQDFGKKKAKATWKIDRLDINTRTVSADPTKTRETKSHNSCGQIETQDSIGYVPIVPLHRKNVIIFFSA